MKGRNLLGLAAVLAALALYAPAAQAASDCGPGPLVMQKSSGIVQQLLAFSTNGTFLPTYAVGVTVGTSGCSNSGVISTGAAERFVAWHGDNLRRDFARGDGEYLASMATLLGCPAGLQAEFARFAQAHVATHESAPTAPAAWVAELRTGLAADPILASGCDAGA